MQEKEKKYSPIEEFVNAFTHAIGTLMAIYGLVLLIVASKTPTQTTTTSIYGATLILLFQSSTCYHAMVNETAKKVFRKIDHSAIFLLIAGTYTPILMLVVPFPHSVALLAVIWYLAAMGIVFSCITLKFKYLNTGLYLLMGWVSLFLICRMWAYSQTSVYLMLAGGLVYSFGCIFYLLKKLPFMHSIWHLFVLGGAILHYFSVMSLLK